jgi:hypothetical protein
VQQKGVTVFVRRQRSLCLLAFLSLGGCFYSFDNPVQLLGSGSVTGNVTLVMPATGQTTQGGTISVLWSGGLSVSLDSSGTFAFLALPDGTYNLSTLIPGGGAPYFDTLFLDEGVVLPISSQGVDAVKLQIPVQASGIVKGNVGSGEANTVVAAFFSIDGGPKTYEGYATTTDGGAYSLLLPAGDHFIYASDSMSAQAFEVPLPAGTTVTQDFVLDAGPSSSDGFLEGNLVLGGAAYGASAPAAEIGDILNAGITYQAFFQDGTLARAGTITSSGQTSLGAPFTVSLPSGQPLDVLLFFPGSVSTGEQFKPLVLRGLPILASTNTYLSQVTWLPVSTFVANGYDGGTGDTYGDAGPSSDGGDGGSNDGGLAWQLVTYFDAGAAASLSDLVPLPIALAGGGYGHRLVWSANGQLVAADDYGGSFGAAQPVPSSGAQPVVGTLAGTFTPSNGNLVAWVNAQQSLEAAYYPPGGAAPNVVTNNATLIGMGNQAVSVFAGSLNADAGAFALLTGQPTFPLLFTSDYQSLTQAISQTINADGGAGGTIEFPITPNTIAGAPCRVSELAGASGICFITNGTFFDGTSTQRLVFTGVFNTSTSTPFIASLQGLEYVPQTQPVALATLPADDAGITPVVIAYQGNSPMWGQFTTLATPIPLSPLPLSNPQLVLPYDAPLALSQGVTSGVTATFLPPPGVPYVFPIGAVQATPLLHGYSNPTTGAPTIAVSTQFAQPPQLQIYELPIDGGAVPDSGMTPDSGMVPDSGLLPDGGWSVIGATINSVDGGSISEVLPLPVPLGAGAWGHRVLWAQTPSIDLPPDSVYATDDSSGTFTTPSPIATQAISVVDLVGTSDSSGNSIAAWIAGINPSTLSVASFPAGGSFTVDTNVDPNGVNPDGLSVLPLTVGPSAGFAVVDFLASGPGNAHLVFLSDAGTQIFDVPIPEIDGGCASTALAAAPCNLPELSGGAGFCLAGSCSNSTNSLVFGAAISTASGSPTVAGHATLASLDAGFEIGPATLLALSSGEVTVQWVDFASGFSFVQFVNLSQAFSVTAFAGVGEVQLSTSLLPWRSNPLAVFTDGSGGVTSLALPSGTAPVPNIDLYISSLTSTYNQPRAYPDPAGGGPIMALLSTLTGMTQTANLFQLPP